MRIAPVAAVLGAGAGAVLGLPALYLSNRLYSSGLNPEADRKPEALDLRITALTPTTVSLRPLTKKPSPRHDEPGRFGLVGARGSGLVGPPVASNGLTFVREFQFTQGQLRVGDAVRLDPFAFPGDPAEAHGIAFETITFESPPGRFPAWFVPGSSGTWAILTHGKGASRRETLRILPALRAAGLPSLAITYRNDVGCPPSPNGMYSYGRDEWEDLEGAARWALDRGARQLLLVGYSMGGATTLAFMGKSELASRVAGLILDAPMIDLTTTVEHGARLLGLPLPVLAISNRVTARRFGFKWQDFDHRPVTRSLEVPVLLFHGDDDRTVPVSTSDAFARSRPDIVEYVRPPGVDHVRAWNADPAGYERAVQEFVGRVAG